MDGEADYTKYSEAELLEIFGRVDPRYAPINCARLKDLLTQRGYIIDDGVIGPGTAVPSAEKMQLLIGSPHPIRFAVRFDQTTGVFRSLEPSHNDFRFVGAGTLEINGIDMWLFGRRAAGVFSGIFGSLMRGREHLSWRGIADVETEGNLVHFTYREDGSSGRDISLYFQNNAAAERLAKVLPPHLTKDFRPRLHAHAEFDQHLLAQSPRTPITVSLVALNALIFLAMTAAGAGLLEPTTAIPLAWGSNFGPYTTDGEWWRLVTSLFIHFGLLHLIFNMWALASFGPLVERLYGSVNYLLVYLIAGAIGSLMSISWRPDINSAGASGAIFGMLGALLAAQVRVGTTFPASVLRPLRNSTLAFTACALIAGFLSQGIDNAAHVGGVTAGFLLGLVIVRPVSGQRLSRGRNIANLSRMLPLGALLLVGGLWSAHLAAESLAGTGVYFRTLHWFKPRERIEINNFVAARALAYKYPKNEFALADEVETHALPFWREADARFSAIDLPSDSALTANLDYIQAVIGGRITSYELLASALRNKDPEAAAAAQREMKRVDDLIQERWAH